MKYFMGDTSLAGLERMMMDPSRRCDGNSAKASRKEKKAPPVQRGGKADK